MAVLRLSAADTGLSDASDWVESVQISHVRHSVLRKPVRLCWTPHSVHVHRCTSKGERRQRVERRLSPVSHRCVYFTISR